MRNRTDVLRWAVAGTIWTVMLFSVLIAFRSSVLTANAAKIASGAATIETVLEYQGAAEFARAFAVEWATWSGNSSEYTERLKVFNPFFKSDMVTPDGEIKRVVGSGVVSIKNIEGTYLVDVFLHTQRLSPLDDKVIIADAYKTQDKKGWAESSYTVRVAVNCLDGKYSISLPMVINTGKSPVQKSQLVYNSQANENIKALAGNFLRTYFSSNNLAEIANYVTPDYPIKPVGGWVVTDIISVTSDSQADPKIVQVELKIKQGSDEFKQLVFLNVVNKGGQYFIKNMMPY